MITSTENAVQSPWTYFCTYRFFEEKHQFLTFLLWLYIVYIYVYVFVVERLVPRSILKLSAHPTFAWTVLFSVAKAIVVLTRLTFTYKLGDLLLKSARLFDLVLCFLLIQFDSVHRVLYLYTHFNHSVLHFLKHWNNNFGVLNTAVPLSLTQKSQ